MTPFVRAMTAAAENRRAATTAFEIADADHWTAAVMRANARGEDMEQFIPQPDHPLPVIEPVEEDDAPNPLFAMPFEDVDDPKMRAAGKDD